MPRGISLHVGINKYSSAFPNANPLKGCEKDANAMARIAEISGFQQRDLLLGCEATYMRVTTKIRSAAAQLEKDDIFFFSFAGHGFQHGEELIGGDEEDDLDETLVLFDAELFDDVFRKELWPSFKPGVRILMVADSCHSGSVNLVPPPDDNVGGGSNLEDFPVTIGGGPIRSIEPGIGDRHQEEYGEFYRSTHLPLRATINASILHLPACSDHQTTADGEENGAFTAAMLKVLMDPNPPADYDTLVERMKPQLPRQTVKLRDDAGQPNPDFRKQKPFTV